MVKLQTKLAKQCRKCKRWKLLVQFKQEKRNRSGKAACCKQCNAESTRERLMSQYKYGDYDILRNAQRNQCAICHTLPVKIDHAVDHCHRTGAIRGLLCRACNLILGYYENGWRPDCQISTFESYLAAAGPATTALLQEHRK